MWNPFKKAIHSQNKDIGSDGLNFDSVISDYLTCSPERREHIRNTFKKENSGKYLLEGHNYAVFAVRRNDYGLVKKGLVLHSIENAQIDWRDNLIELTLLYNSARNLKQDPDTLFIEIADISGKRMKELLTNYTKRKDSLKTLEGMGYKEIFEPEFDYIQLSST